ncbi:protein SRC2 homolog [Salvia hispanica]|uniref:protein SRC2 homolog n=1 Tax=Salvia hispanica TaxID=49212 RepID=UPI00200944CD|nr:protein SRC2 homolog [Salvia hispanica]
MECRKFEIIIVSADNLPDVRSFGRMKVYAEVSINGEPDTSRLTTVDTEGETNPRWNFPLEYTIEEASLQNPELVVGVKLYCERTLGDRYIGEVNISVKGLFDYGPRGENVLSYTVDGAGNGKLNILYSFGNKFMAPKPSFGEKVLDVGLSVMEQGTLFFLSEDV